MNPTITTPDVTYRTMVRFCLYLVAGFFLLAALQPFPGLIPVVGFYWIAAAKTDTTFDEELASWLS